MTVLRRPSFSSLLFLCFPLLANLSQTSDAVGSAMIQAINCSTSGNYTPSSAYAANLNQFLAKLPENAVSKNGGFFNGTVGDGVATVYGLAMCSTGYSRADCGACLAATAGSNTGGLPTRCPGSTTVLAVFDKCLVRYSGTNFLGTAETDIIYSSSAGEAPSTPMAYSGKVQDRLQQLTGEAVTSPQRFAAFAAGPPYALTQCTWDLPPDTCKQCLDLLSANASYWFKMTTEGERKSYSCTVRYSNSNFTVVPFSDASSGPVPPTSSSLDHTGTSAPPSTARSSRTIATVLGSVIAVGVVALLAGSVWHVRSRNQRKTLEEDIKTAGHNQVTATPSTCNETIGQGHTSAAFTENGNDQGSGTIVYVPRAFTYAQLVEATNNFAKKKELGHGAFGAVYKGRLPGIDMAVAIKEIIETSTDQAKRAFSNEIRIMSKLHHRNILRLLGWCEEDKNLLLIYEMMKNGNLEDCLYPRKGSTDSAVWVATDDVTHLASPLNWDARLNILIGIASGLQYLHKDCPVAILHRDIKPANVLLDKDFNAKLADFGLVTEFSHTQTSHPTDNVIGTRSYIDPAYVENGRACGQSDVYSLGVMLLEIVCGEKPMIQPDGKNSLIEKVRKCRDDIGENSIVEAADRRLRGTFDQGIKTVLELGLSCVRTDNRQKRPHIGLVKYKLVQLAGGLRSVKANGTTASTSHNNPQPSEEVFGTCSDVFPTHSPGDEEAGVSPLLAKN